MAETSPIIPSCTRSSVSPPSRKNLRARARTALRHAVNTRDDRRHLTQGRVLDPVGMREVEIAPRDRKEEVLHALDTELAEGLLPCTRYKFETAHVIRERRGGGETRRARRERDRHPNPAYSIEKMMG